jgi:hypothetical protein
MPVKASRIIIIPLEMIHAYLAESVHMRLLTTHPTNSERSQVYEFAITISDKSAISDRFSLLG